MNRKGKKKLHLSTETIRRLSPEGLGKAAGGATDYCSVITRCMFSCPCEQTNPCETYSQPDHHTCDFSCWEGAQTLCGC